MVFHQSDFFLEPQLAASSGGFFNLTVQIDQLIFELSTAWGEKRRFRPASLEMPCVGPEDVHDSTVLGGPTRLPFDGLVFFGVCTAVSCKFHRLNPDHQHLDGWCMPLHCHYMSAPPHLCEAILFAWFSKEGICITG